MSRELYIDNFIGKLRIIVKRRDPVEESTGSLVPRLGIEPRTQGFSVPCSTN